MQYIATPLARLLGRDLQSDFTPFRIALAAANRTFSCAAARRDFGYVPQVGGCLVGAGEGERVEAGAEEEK